MTTEDNLQHRRNNSRNLKKLLGVTGALTLGALGAYLGKEWYEGICECVQNVPLVKDYLSQAISMVLFASAGVLIGGNLGRIRNY